MKQKYVLLSESIARKSFPDKLFSGSATLVWSDYTLGKNSKCGAVRMSPPAVDERLSHEAFAAFNDITSFESQHARSELSQFAEQGTAILHAMGYYQDNGFRRMLLIPPNGFAKNLIRQNSMVPLNLRICPGGKSNASMDEIISDAIYLTLSEAPSAYLFLHFLGREVDLETVTRYVRIMPEYQKVSGGLLDLSDHPAQLQNMTQLMIMEDRCLTDPAWSYRVAYAYRKEVDQSQYWLFGNGKFLGSNNIRGMNGIIQRALRTVPRDCLLVHRLGSELDFDLVNKVLAIDPKEGMIERPERVKVKDLR